MITIDKIKKLREQTEISIGECKKAMEMAGGDFEKAKDILKKWGEEVAKKKKERVASKGIVDSYIHPNKQVGVLLELNCESDFVARSPDFQNLAHELCLQIAGFNNEEISILDQPWIKDESRAVKDLIDELIAKFGENIVIKGFVRYSL